MAGALYIDTSAALRAVLEAGTTPALERRLARAGVLVTSRLSLVESARAVARLRHSGRAGEPALADAARTLDALWARCEVWELTESICDGASHVAPEKPLRTLDALHLATYFAARRDIDGLDLLTADTRLAEAAGL